MPREQKGIKSFKNVVIFKWFEKFNKSNLRI
jgi:hypothetical protein